MASCAIDRFVDWAAGPLNDAQVTIFGHLRCLPLEAIEELRYLLSTVHIELVWSVFRRGVARDMTWSCKARGAGCT